VIYKETEKTLCPIEIGGNMSVPKYYYVDLMLILVRKYLCFLKVIYTVIMSVTGIMERNVIVLL
jgi:hypothetical protein